MAGARRQRAGPGPAPARQGAGARGARLGLKRRPLPAGLRLRGAGRGQRRPAAGAPDRRRPSGGDLPAMLTMGGVGLWLRAIPLPPARRPSTRAPAARGTGAAHELAPAWHAQRCLACAGRARGRRLHRAARRHHVGARSAADERAQCRAISAGAGPPQASCLAGRGAARRSASSCRPRPRRRARSREPAAPSLGGGRGTPEPGGSK